MDFCDICDEFNNYPEYNFIGGAITIQQVNGIDVAIMQLRSKGIDVKGKIILRTHPATGLRVSADMFHSLNDNIEVCKVDEPYKNRSKFPLMHVFKYLLPVIKKNNYRIVYVALPDVNFQWINFIEQNISNCKVKVIVIDDGGCSYVNEYKALWQSLRCTGSFKEKIVNIGKFIIRKPIVKMMTLRLSSEKRLICNRLFEKKGNDFIRNKSIVKYYDELYKIIGKSIPKEIVNRFENSAIINTQCLKEGKLTDGEADFDLYKRLVRELKKKGIKVIIKTHPRELNPEKYKVLDCDVYSDIQYTQESIIAATVYRPVCVVSLFSATLLNIRGIFGIQAVSLADIMRHEYKITKACCDSLEAYKKIYGSVILFTTSIDETVDKIYELAVDNGDLSVNL